jgi:hypothetical protein
VTTRHDEELPVPHFKDRLWRELEELHGSPDHAEPAERAGRARAVRRPRLLVAAAVVAVGGAVAGVVLLSGRDEPTTVIAPAGQSTTTAEVTTTEATRPLGIVMTEHRNAEGHVQRTWKDEQTGLWRDLSIDPDGRPMWDRGYISRRQEGDEVIIATRDVDHCFREYQDDELRLPIETVREAMPENVRVGTVPEARFDDGSLVADGTETVDGRELERYRDVGNDGVLWLDPETHDVVRRHYSAGSDLEQSETLEYLARTPENLAALVPEVPPGYTTPWTDHTDEDRAVAGCG